jgi:threonine/homoserine/homoserine lactone efflux protein
MSAYFWRGFLVIWSNPKALLFFGAFIPQFVDPSSSTIPQVLLLGLTMIVLSSILDGTYALVTGKIGTLLTRPRLRLLERLSGSVLIGGGLWLALNRR